MHAAVRIDDERLRRPRRTPDPRAFRMSFATASPAQPSEGRRHAAMIASIASSGDRDAFARLFGHFAPRVKSYLLRLGATSEAAEDLAQETLLTVWRRAASYDPSKAAASTWIFTIARNLRIDLARRESRPPPQAVEPDASTAAAPDAMVGAAQDEARVRRAMESLPKDQAEVVRLAFFADKPHSEIAGELDLPLGTVKSRLRLAMVRLRAAFEDPS
ncbi:MAG TPA: sigma-70 family RNA polymerase sigma factor [Caulobacteraceae bacterium]|jgi:RNA polymerase sigma-70 factor (ECF subfamily)|nr:sigma-70 family RNA polymerase sigma factor [Caulobacteraceae bacterium]